MAELIFSVTTGQTEDIIILPELADDSLTGLDNLPTVVAVDPTVFKIGPVTLNADGKSYTVGALGLKKGATPINISAIGAGGAIITAEADGTVTNPLAVKLALKGKLHG